MLFVTLVMMLFCDTLICTLGYHKNLGYMLVLNNLSVALASGQSIIHRLTLTIEPGTIHALMGSNGSGKSTLAYTLMGHPQYIVTEGTIIYKDHDITQLATDKRAKAGIFLAFQHPYELPGVTVCTFLKESYGALHGVQLSIKEFQIILFAAMEQLSIDHSFAYRHLNAGFSGGEKKRMEMLQLLLLKPTLAILDEIDSGLDLDALKVVADGLQYVRQRNPSMAVVIITHNPRMLHHITPDVVHIMHQGSIVRSGDNALVQELEHKGYDGVKIS